jgi:cytochrome P450
MCNDLGLINTTAPVVTFAKSHMKSRLAEDKSSAEQQERRTSKRPDFLARFLEANKKDPDFVDHQRVLSLTVTNVFAGSDTTGITLRAVFYYLMKNPTTLTKLRKELDSADLGPKESMVSWEQARNLPYLTAVIQESLRIHPAVGLPLERIVPPHGLAVNGSFIPPGTIVGASAWVLHAKESIFGAKPLEFRPERWIEASEEKRTEMNNALFTFGMGARTCIGKNISLLEMYKLVPTLLRRYEVRCLFFVCKYSEISTNVSS